MEVTNLEINARDRKVLLEALALLEDRQAGQGRASKQDTINHLRGLLATRTRGIDHPDHVFFKVQEFQTLMTVAPAAFSWRLTLTPDGDSYNLTAHLRSEDQQWDFQLASGLRGTGRFFELADDDLAFYKSIEKRIDEKMPNSKISHEILEIPLAVDFEPDDDLPARLEGYLCEYSDGEWFVPEVHAASLDVETDDELAALGHMNVLAYVSWGESGMHDVRDFIAHVNDSIRNSSPMPRP